MRKTKKILEKEIDLLISMNQRFQLDLQSLTAKNIELEKDNQRHVDLACRHLHKLEKRKKRIIELKKELKEEKNKFTRKLVVFTGSFAIKTIDTCKNLIQKILP